VELKRLVFASGDLLGEISLNRTRVELKHVCCFFFFEKKNVSLNRTRVELKLRSNTEEGTADFSV